MCANVAFTAFAKSSRESTSVPSRSKIRSSILTYAAEVLCFFARTARTAVLRRARPLPIPNSCILRCSVLRWIPNCLLAAHWFPALCSSAPWIMLRSRISIASGRKIFPPSKCSISASNFSFILSLCRAGQFAKAVFETFLPRRFYLRVGFTEAFPHLVRGHRCHYTGAIDDIWGRSRMHHRRRGAAARRKRHDPQNEGHCDQQSARQSEAGAEQVIENRESRHSQKLA